MLESLSGEELQFIKAIEKYKQENRKLFLSWTEVLKIVKQLGYRRTGRRAAARSDASKGGKKGSGAEKATDAASPPAGADADGEKETETARPIS